MLHHILKNKIIIIIALALVICSCASTKTDSYSELSGTFIQKPFINKIGQEKPKFKEWYFVVSDTSEYFVKLSKSKVPLEKIKQSENKKCRIKGIIRFGMFDSEDPNVQSRAGEYLELLEIESE
ncbi:MAG: hypothetical protein WCT77_09805 [Bacteroidota bacterium]|jgi:hypothetical protein